MIRVKQIKCLTRYSSVAAKDIQVRSFCKWHNSYTHSITECRSFRNAIQSRIKEGPLKIPVMKVDKNPFPRLHVGASGLIPNPDEGTSEN